MLSVFKYKALKECDNFKEENKYLIDSILYNQVYMSSKEKLNDPTEGYFDLNKEFNIKCHNFIDERCSMYDNMRWNLDSNNYGVLSLSKTFQCELMWAYYANAHKGIVLEYDLNQLKKDIKKTSDIESFDVNYNENALELKFEKIYSIAHFILKYKSISWKHENEYRIITKNHQGLVKYKDGTLKSITFGLRVSNEIKRKLFDLIKDKCKEFYVMEMNMSNYEMYRKKYKKRDD